ncbi:MAG: SufB/SufD family protein [Acidimicrobiales bacterium]
MLAAANFDADAFVALPGPAWLREARRSSWELFARSPAPSESDEIWRYSRIDELDLERYAPCPAAATEALGLADLPANVRDLVSAAGPAATVLVSHNGGYGHVVRPQAGLEVHAVGGPPGRPNNGAADAVPDGAPATGPEALTGELLPARAGPRADVWTAFNGAFARVRWTVRVAPGSALRAPLVVVHWLDHEGGAIFPRLQVELGTGSSALVVEVVASPEVDVLSVPVTELRLARGARLGFGYVQLLGGQAWQLGNQVSRVGAEAALRSMTYALGGSYARVRTDSVLEGPGGDSELLAAYFGCADQMHDLRTVQYHAAPNSRSNLLFKGAVANRARSVYSGLIRVERGARGTNAFQTNRNLVLSEGAQADSVPNLEIEDNDVRCSHASAVGPIDESQLFYLESRGVPTRSAERLIALGFMDDVLGRFPVGGMRAWLRRALVGKLDEAGLGAGPEGRQG